MMPKKNKLTLLERREVARKILSYENWLNLLKWGHKTETYNNLGIPEYKEDVNLRITNI
jgi:hypothetical protein